MRLRAEILALLSCGISLAGIPLTHAQDATSANLPEPAETLSAEPVTGPKKAKSKPRPEIAAKASNQRPLLPAAEPTPQLVPVTEDTPIPEEPEPTAVTPRKKARVKKRQATSVQPEPASSPVAAPLSLSAAQAIALSALLPEYPYEAKHRDVVGSGVCVMTVDTASGKVTSAMMTQSTGNALLDKVTTETFKRWRFKPGTVSQVRVPITYE